MFEKGSFIKWSSTDEEGEFSYTGLVLNCTNTHVTFTTSPNAGEMCVPLDEGTFVKARKPKNWDESAIKTTLTESKKIELKPEKPKKARGGKKSSGESKIDKAVEIYRELMSKHDEHPPKDEVIKAFIKKLNMTDAGASTYYYNVKKKV